MSIEPGSSSAEATARYAPPTPAEGWQVAFSVDGEDHHVVVDVRESLWETMTYRLGLTGANMGCDRAQCGICNVLVDGRAVNSCSVLTARLAGKDVRTVAGLHSGDTVGGLHPLQRAFWEEAAFQCGICTKGFIMTSYALLQSNPDPSDDDIRNAIAGVLCRCGEGPRIVRAIKRAAAELRDGRPAGYTDPHASGTTLMPHTSEVIGTSVPRIQGFGSVTDKGNYLSLQTLPGMAFVRTLRSPYPRAKVVSIDTTAAERLPGVIKILHRFNLPEQYLQVSIEGPPPRRLFNEEVVQVGMPVALVAAETEHIADDALALIDVEYDVLEPALDYLTAAGADKQWDNPLPGTIRNIIKPVVVGEPDAALAEADLIVEHITTTPYEQHLPLELRTGLYYWEGEKLVTYQTTHRTFDVRRELARWLSLPEDDVRIIQTGFMGSSYGSADHLVEELVLPAVMAKLIQRPVRSMLTREESFLTSAHRGRTRTRVKLGVSQDGDFQGVDVEVLYDGGTNAGLPASAAAAEGLTGIGVRGGWYVFEILYSYPHQKYEGTEVWTNNFRAGPMRGVGRNFGLFALETAIEKAAYEAGIDPLQLRLRNLNETGAVFDEMTGAQPGLKFGRTGGLRASLLRAAELIGWDRNWHPPYSREIRPGVFHGIGIVSAVDRGGGRQGGATPEAAPPPSTGQVVLHTDGTLEVFSGSTEVGAGQRTLMAMIAAQAAGIPLDEIAIATGVDTAVNTNTGPSNSSLQTNVAGWAVLEAAGAVKELLLAEAAPRLSAQLGRTVGPDDLGVRDGWITVTGRTDVRVLVREIMTGLGKPLRAASDRRRRLTAESVAMGAHAVEVAVDTATGGIEVLHYAAVHDVGRVLNRISLIQQVEGGVMMGLGGTLHEELLVDDVTGVPITANILEYKPPTTLEVPPMDVDFVEVPQDYGPYGAVAIGQASTPPVAPAVANAIYNAVGIWVADLPFSPSRMLAALGERG